METNDLQRLWNVQNQKLDSILLINKEMATELTLQRLNKEVNRLYLPKLGALTIGLPYTLILYAVTAIGILSGAPFVGIGFGVISAIMTITLITYFYHLYLIGAVKRSNDIINTQRQLAKLRITGFNCLRLSIFQLPFWSICWVSMDAITNSPLIYGGINLLVFLVLAGVSYWIFQELSPEKSDSKVRKFFFSGSEWEPIEKATGLLSQLKDYEKEKID